MNCSLHIWKQMICILGMRVSVVFKNFLLHKLVLLQLRKFYAPTTSAIHKEIDNLWNIKLYPIYWKTTFNLLRGKNYQITLNFVQKKIEFCKTVNVHSTRTTDFWIQESAIPSILLTIELNISYSIKVLQHMESNQC